MMLASILKDQGNSKGVLMKVLFGCVTCWAKTFNGIRQKRWKDVLSCHSPSQLPLFQYERWASFINPTFSNIEREQLLPFYSRSTFSIRFFALFDMELKYKYVVNAFNAEVATALLTEQTCSEWLKVNLTFPAFGEQNRTEHLALVHVRTAIVVAPATFLAVFAWYLHPLQFQYPSLSLFA